MPDALRAPETRLPCPVCLGATMEKTPVCAPNGEAALLLDHCGRCGGIWFEAGEVRRLQACGAEALWRAVVRRTAAAPMRCHACHGLLGRDEAACAACGWRNVLDCPCCLRPMEVATHDGIRLDVCRACRGAWFDHAELASIWRLELAAAVQRRAPRALDGAKDGARDGAFVLLDVLTYSPELAFVGARAAGHAIGASAQALAHAPEAVGAAAEVAGEAAAGVFETIAEIIGGLFS